MSSNKLLSEVERQEKVLAALPSDFTFPLFNAQRALESQRKSAYRNTAAAGREIVDNSIEAGATRVDVIFRQEKGPGGKRNVTEIAFIDDGSGMVPKMAQYALSWGGGTHHEDPDFIGRFGFGLPNASINQARRVDVYTKVRADDPIMRAYLDIDKYKEDGIQKIEDPEPADLPGWVEEYMSRNGLALDHGTVVVWSKCDRLSKRTAAYLKDHMVDDFGVVYRYLLRGSGEDTSLFKFDLIVEGVEVQPVDPLFIHPWGRYYLPPEDGGAQLTFERSLPVELTRDDDTGEASLRLLGEPEDIDKAPGTIGTIYIRVARLPVDFAVGKGTKGRDVSDANRRWMIRQPRRGMSFVRAGRELQTVDLFPRSPSDVASGLGRWPLLQSYAYHWGIEVQFGPELDDAFGITNDKQGVRPIEDFWRVLTEAEVDAAVRREQRWQTEQRDRTLPKPRPDSGPSPAELAAMAADAATGQTRPHLPPHRADEAEQEFERGVKAATPGGTQEGSEEALRDEARAAALEEKKRHRYRVDYVDVPSGPFFEPKWDGPQILVEINKEHPFYRVLYGDLLRLPGGSRAKEAVDVLLITLAKAELEAEEEMALWYTAQRKQRWSPYLETAIEALAQRLPWSEDFTAEASEEVIAAEADASDSGAGSAEAS